MPGTRLPRHAVVRIAVAAALLMFVGCGGTSVEEFEDQLWEEIKGEFITASKPDCPKNAKVEDGQSFTCNFSYRSLATKPSTPGDPTPLPDPTDPAEAPEYIDKKVDVTVKGDEFSWKVKE